MNDKSLSEIKKLYREDRQDILEKADELIKNTYRVLITRGMKGCYIYCVFEKNLVIAVKFVLVANE